MKHYYTGKGGDAEPTADAEMNKLIALNILFDEELKVMAQWIMVGMIGATVTEIGGVSAVMAAGWSPNKVAEATGWFTGKYLQSLCRTGHIDHHTTVGGYLITAKGVGQLYEKWLRKERK